MSIESIASAAASGSTVGADRNLIADNLDTFLQLLTTQLQNQNPLDPIDSNQFTEQLVQFSSVEQAVKSNDLLASLLASTAANTTSTAVGYIGKFVEASGATTLLDSDGASWIYELSKDSPEASVSIRNAAGTVVFTDQTELAAGEHTYKWTGNTSAGGTASPGLYTITINALDADGNNLRTSTSVSGKVTGVEFEGSEPVLKVGATRISLSSVKSVTIP